MINSRNTNDIFEGKNMKKPILITMLLALVLLLNSCMSVGNKFDYNALSNLKSGDSEQKVIETLGGQPNSKTSNDDGTYDLTWKYVNANLFGGKGIGAIIRFSEDGKMLKIVKQGANKAGF